MTCPPPDPLRAASAARKGSGGGQSQGYVMGNDDVV